MGKLYLLPNLLDPSNSIDLLPQRVISLVPTLDGLIVETPKEARKYLKKFSFPEGKSFRDLPMYPLNEHTTKSEKQELVTKIKQGKIGLISDCGLPCVGDPGNDLVSDVRRKGITIEAYLGPCAILKAYILAGYKTQAFAFHGYLPKEEQRLKKRIHFLEKLSKELHQAQICIEAPYRTDRLLQTFLSELAPSTLLTVALDLDLPSEEMITDPIAIWKKQKVSFGKRPAIFLFMK